LAGPVIVGVGSGFTLTFTGAETAVQPPLVMFTVYVPAVVTMIDCVVAPFDQRYDAAGSAVSVTLPPSQNVVGPLGVTFAVGVESMVIACVSVPLQPFASVTVTLYVSDVVTLMTCEVAPVDQRYDA
jgi:hypothetical protein